MSDEKGKPEESVPLQSQAHDRPETFHHSSVITHPSNRLFVISGASGAGKDTLLLELLKRHPELERCVTFTTRAPRVGEADGVDYHFTDEPTFRRMIEEEALLEWAEVYGRLYGNSKEWVLGRLAAGASVVMRIDIQGALTIKRKMSEAVLIYVAPPSLEELERRLRSRASESPEELAVRLNAARWEMEQIPHFDYVVVNDDLEDALGLIGCILRAESARIPSGKD
ncbi:MAG: guanylate kinase [Armatimonadetes bacterium]|nr:guanylate kinase [Armatimonadota bacterium]